MKKSVFGKCHICGFHKKLTADHVPNQRSFNSDKYVSEPNDEGFKQIMQGGIKYQSLCDNCNNNMGSWYADSYTEFVKQAHRQGNINDCELELRHGFVEIYPLRVIKQIITAFFSFNSIDWCDIYRADFIDFLMDKEKIGIDDKKYRIGIVLLAGNQHYTGGLSEEFVGIDGKTYIARICTAILHFPIGIVLEHGKRGKDFINIGADITMFANSVSYNDKMKVELILPVYDVLTFEKMLKSELEK